MLLSLMFDWLLSVILGSLDIAAELRKHSMLSQAGYHTLHNETGGNRVPSALSPLSVCD